MLGLYAALQELGSAPLLASLRQRHWLAWPALQCTSSVCVCVCICTLAFVPEVATVLVATVSLAGLAGAGLVPGASAAAFLMSNAASAASKASMRRKPLSLLVCCALATRRTAELAACSACSSWPLANTTPQSGPSPVSSYEGCVCVSLAAALDGEAGCSTVGFEMNGDQSVRRAFSLPVNNRLVIAVLPSTSRWVLVRCGLATSCFSTMVDMVCVHHLVQTTLQGLKHYCVCFTNGDSWQTPQARRCAFAGLRFALLQQPAVAAVPQQCCHHAAPFVVDHFPPVTSGKFETGCYRWCSMSARLRA